MLNNKIAEAFCFFKFTKGCEFVGKCERKETTRKHLRVMHKLSPALIEVVMWNTWPDYKPIYIQESIGDAPRRVNATGKVAHNKMLALLSEHFRRDINHLDQVQLQSLKNDLESSEADLDAGSRLRGPVEDLLQRIVSSLATFGDTESEMVVVIQEPA